MQAAARFREAIAILEHARDRAASSGCDLDLAERAATAVRDTVLRECIAAGLYANPSLLGDGSPIRVSSGVDAALMDEEDPPTALVASAPATPPFSPCAAEFAREGGELVDPVLSGVKALLIDLDGTMYSPSGPIPGADEFYGYLLRQRLPYVFLSNTGAKGAHGVQAKLAKNGFLLQAAPVPTDNIYTAAQAQCAYMADHIPHHARVFVIAGGVEGEDAWWMELLTAAAERVATWELRTRLTEEEAKEWAAIAGAAIAAAPGEGRPKVFVVLFTDGSISSSVDPKTNERGYADWSFDVIKKATWLLTHGAEFVCTAEDAFNPTKEGLPLPGPGMFSAMFRKVTWPLGRHRHRVLGKGGGAAEGGKYMVGHAIEMLRRQGFDGELHEVLIVGDRFDTDIRAGVAAGLRTCLVESGCHRMELQPYYPADRATYVAASVAELLPQQWLPRSFVFRTALAPARTPPRRCSDSLRSWALSRGNIVYASSAHAPSTSLIERLRHYFDAMDPGCTGTMPAADSYLALRLLGIAPQQRPVPRPASLAAGLVFPSRGRSSPAVPAAEPRPTGESEGEERRGGGEQPSLGRITFRQFCSEVQRGFELAVSGAPVSPGGVRPTACELRAAAAQIMYSKDAVPPSRRGGGEGSPPRRQQQSHRPRALSQIEPALRVEPEDTEALLGSSPPRVSSPGVGAAAAGEVAPVRCHRVRSGLTSSLPSLPAAAAPLFSDAAASSLSGFPPAAQAVVGQRLLGRGGGQRVSSLGGVPISTGDLTELGRESARLEELHGGRLGTPGGMRRAASSLPDHLYRLQPDS
mmetsp:Transcript_5123/g.17104  ORF Transcript_5123/g.17104 Transcript_5123/m.17104 type:complete len:808 (+) Transcript_5123:146-2569(+)